MHVDLSTEKEPQSQRTRRDVLARLKSETAPDHAAIEAATGLMREGLTLSDYRTYLAKSHGFYAVVEPRLRQLGVWDELALSAAARAKLPLLERDLEQLGCAPASLRQCSWPPELNSVAHGVGCAYVLEGSTLGGRVLSRHMQARLGDVPRAFFDCYGTELGAQWQAFRVAAVRFTRTRALEDQVVAGARETFRAFTRWLQEE